MPTLLNTNAFSFHPSAKNIDEKLKILLENEIAVNIIIKILQEKERRGKELFDNIYLLDGRTGSGKSTVLITQIYKTLCNDPLSKNSILAVEPRVALCNNNANDICRYVPNLEINNNVAILTGETKNKLKKNGIVYCTSAILSERIKKALEENNPRKLYKRYKYIVIDEVHTLGEPELTLLILIKQYLEKFKQDLKYKICFIFTSATIDMDQLINYYFQDIDPETIYEDPLMTGFVKGAMNFQVNETFEKNPSPDLGKYVCKLIPELFSSKSTITVYDRVIPCRDMLIFCPSASQISKVSQGIIENFKTLPLFYTCQGTLKRDVDKWRNMQKNKQRINIIEFATSIKSCASDLLANPVENNEDVNANEIRIIISTPVIESGKTISTLAICIDLGMHLKPINYSLNIMTQLNDTLEYKRSNIVKTKAIQVLPIDKFMATQRLGRVGREAPGKFIHYYSKEIYNSFKKSSISDFENMVACSNVILPITQEGTLIDPINKNVFLLVFGVDASILTYYDCVTTGLATVNGIQCDLSLNSAFIEDRNWLLYAQYMYLILDYSLIDALVIASVNRKEINNRLRIDEFIIKSFRYTKENIPTITSPDETFTNNIKEAFVIYNHIKFNANNTHFGFPFLLNKVNVNTRS